MGTNVTIITDCSEKTIAEEMSHPCLNELGFVRAANAKEQWYLLVNQAWHESQLPENQVVKEYLGTMLERSVTTTDLFEKLRSFEYVEHILGLRPVAHASMQEVADMSLQYVAFFPERSTYRHEPRSLAYSAELGVSLYRELAWQSAGKDDWFSKAYAAMANSFGQAVIVLRSVCPRFIKKKEVQQAVRERGVRFLADHEATKALTQLRNFDLMFCEQLSAAPLQ